MPFKDLPEGQTHSQNDGCGEPAHNMPSPIEKILEEFSEKVNELRRETHWGEATDSPVHEFGHKTSRPLPGIHGIRNSEGRELFTVVDWGHVQSFLKQSLEKVYAEREKDLVERIEGMNNFRQAKVDGKDDWNDALEQSARKVDALLQAIKGK